MSVAIETFVEFAEVRAALGISTHELTDTQIGLDMYGELLFQELSAVEGTLAPDTVSRNLIAQYAYLKALSSPTANQTLLKSYIRLFALYVVAAAIGDTVPLLAPKTISDGKALMTRFSPERTFELVRQEVIQKKYDLRRKIKTLFGITITDKVYLGVVAPAIDVVTDAVYES
jgi:hypothetical protein